jgi:hypothetical protein
MSNEAMDNKQYSNAGAGRPGSGNPGLDSAPADPFLISVRRELDHGCDAIDGYTLSRLNRIRHAALEHKQTRIRSVWLPAGGFATACMLVLAVSLNSGQSDPVQVTPALEDLEILTSSDNLELFEDYEFYQWLADNETSV